MNDNEFWVKVWKVIAIILCVLIVSSAGCTANRHYQTRALIESGKADSLGARCAIDGDGSAACSNITMRDMVNAGRK